MEYESLVMHWKSFYEVALIIALWDPFWLQRSCAKNQARELLDIYRRRLRSVAGHEWFPFGGGNRTCLGMAFAMYEMRVVLGTLLTQVSLVRPPGSRSKPIRRGLVLAPHDGVVMTINSRLEH